MKTRRIVCLLLALLMVFAVAGCGESKYIMDDDDDSGWGDEVVVSSTKNDEESEGGDVDSAAGQTQNQQSTGATNLSWEEVKALIPASAKGKTIEFMDWNPLDNVAQAPAICAKFTEETGIKIKFTEEGYDTYSTKIAARVAAGNSPDVVRVREEVPMWVKYLQPINNLKYNFNDVVWDKSVLNAYTFRGKTYAVNMVDSPYYQPEIVAYNKDLITKYGLEDPYTIWSKNHSAWTWEKMNEIGQKFIDAAPDGYFGVSGVFGEYSFSLGAPFVSFNGTKYTSNMKNSKFIKAWQSINSWQKTGLYSKQAYDQDNFGAGKILFYIDAEINLRNGHFAFKNLKKTNSLKAVPVPCVAGQSTYYLPMGETQAYGIPQGSKNAELVPYFLRYLLDVKNYDMSKFYCDNTSGAGSIYEVVQWTRDPANHRISTLNTIMDGPDGYCGYAIGSFYNELISTDQVKTYIDQTLAPGMETACSEATKQISKLK